MSLPETEKNNRIQKVRQLLLEKELDFVFVYYDEHNVMNGRYLTGFSPTVERGAVIVSQDCEPFLVGGPEAEPYAKLESAIKETVNCPVFMVPEEEYPMADVYDFKQISRKYFGGRTIKRVGMVGINTVPYQIYAQLAKDLDTARIVDVTHEFERLRYVKSEWEIGQVKKAFDIADKAFQKLKENVVEGKHEYEAAAEGEYVARKMGGDGLGYRTILGTAERAKAIIPVSSDRVFKNGELVIAGISPRYNGYNSTACSPLVVGGKPNATQERWIKDACEALHRTREALKPGLSGIEIDSVPRKFLLGKGYREYMTMPFVHNCGLSEFEKPFFGPSSKDIIQENQVICIDISMFNHKEIPGIRAETAYLMTAKGAVLMSRYMESLFGF